VIGTVIGYEVYTICCHRANLQFSQLHVPLFFVGQRHFGTDAAGFTPAVFTLSLLSPYGISWFGMPPGSTLRVTRNGRLILHK
jgi:hypothetical protein